jgi:hypothetical protein
VTGDMTDAFSFGLPPRTDIPLLPDTSKALQTAEDEAMALPLPTPPVTPVMPRQEPGVGHAQWLQGNDLDAISRI